MPDENEKYVGAPYNFISLPDKVYERYPDITKLPAHDRSEKNHLEKDCHSGHIRYEIKAESPIMINDGDGNFYKNINGEHAIPGSSIRGLVRSNAQVLGLSSIGVDVENYRLMYRAVGQDKHNPLKDRYQNILGSCQVKEYMGDGKEKKISILKEVKAGYLRKEKGDYYIHPVVTMPMPDDRGKMNYYPLSERRILSENMAFFMNERTRLQNLTIRGRDYYKKNSEYRPYCCPISYNVKNAKVTGVGSRGEDGYVNEGYVISSGYIGKKKMQYIIPRKDEEKEGMYVEKEFIRNYMNDYMSKKKQLGEKMRDFFALPEEGEEKPVFYIFDKVLYFGFTPNLRLYFDNMIHDGLPKEHKVLDEEGNPVVKLDYNMSLFGFTTNNGSYKSRLHFFDATAEDTSKGSMKEMILSGPKPTSYMDYLTQEDKGTATYNNPSDESSQKKEFRLRGVKQYWLHNEMPRPDIGKNRSVTTKFVPLEGNSTFTGNIHFSNLTGDELGLLLWSLALEPGCAQNIGQGKPYGFGKIRISIKGVELFDYEKMYLSRGLCLEPEKEGYNLVNDFLSAYKEHMKEYMGIDIEKMPHIEEFFLMKKEDCIPKNEMTRYMRIDSDKERDEYRNRSKPLPDVKEVIAGEKAALEKSCQTKKEAVPKAAKKEYSRTDDVKREDKVKSKANSTSFYSRGNGFSGLKGFRVDQ